MKHFKILVWLNSPQVKWYMKNSEIMKKTQSWVEEKPSTQSAFQKKKILVLVVKNCAKTDIKVSRPVQFCLISWLCFINFDRDCSLVIGRLKIGTRVSFLLAARSVILRTSFFPSASISTILGIGY